MRTLLFSATVLLASTVAAQETETFTSAELGLAFEHPKTWTVAKQKNKKDVIATIPIEGKAQPASLEIYSAVYDDTAEQWEALQAQVNKQLKRDVVRQWREEILGVPMLLTRVSYDDKGLHKDVLTGIIYSKTPRKLLFRLSAPTDSYDDAEYQFRQALQSLKTTTGALPQAEDGERPPPPEKPVKGQPSNQPLKRAVLDRPAEPQKVKLGDVTQQVHAGGADHTFRVPAGWTVTPNSDGSLTLKHANVPGEMKVMVHSTLDTERPDLLIVKESAKSLALFKSISNRQEERPVPNKAGATATSIWRTGAGEAGPLMSIEAYGIKGDVFWFLTYNGAPLDKKAVAAVKELIQGASIEPMS